MEYSPPCHCKAFANYGVSSPSATSPSTPRSQSPDNVNVTSTTYYTQIAIKNSLPVPLKRIRFAHISKQELNVQAWDNVPSGQTLPAVWIKYATGMFKW